MGNRDIVRVVMLAMVLVLGSRNADAQESGTFYGVAAFTEERLKECFKGNEMSALTVFRLSAELTFVDASGLEWRVPSNSCVNGDSVPSTFRGFLGEPWSEPFRRALVIHDYYVRIKDRAWPETHRVLYDAMIASDVPTERAKVIYFSVRRFGERWESRTKNVPVCLDGSTDNCLSWGTEVLASKFSIKPEIPIHVEEIVRELDIYNLSVEEIEEIADRKFQLEVLSKF